jgi:hypothetical protein
MNDYQKLRTKQKESHLIGSGGAMHRVQLMNLEGDGFSAPEGSVTLQEAPPRLKVPRGETSWLGPIIGALAVSAVVVLSYIAMVAK